MGRWKVSSDRVELSLKGALLDEAKVAALRAYVETLLEED